MIIMKLLLAFFLAGASLAVGQEVDTLPPLKDGRSPRNFEEMWAGFDPRAEPLEVEVLKEWEEEGVVLRVVRFRIGVFKGQTARLAAIFGFPKNAAKSGTKLPGLVQIHGGGQYADHKACLLNAKRGYATVSLAWAGRISAPDYRVTPKEVKLFWDGNTDDPAYRLTTDWGAVDGYHAPGRNPGNVFPSAKPAAWTLDDVESPRNSGWFLCALAARRALTFLEQQPEVDPNRLGVYGHSMGGKLTVMTAVDSRVKAAAPSCGGISNRDNSSPLFRATVGDDVSLKKISCPIVFLSPANDFHGRIGDLPKAITEINTDQWRVICSPHHNHQDTPQYEVATMLWMDQHLRDSFSFPQTPETTLSLKTDDGVPSFNVHPDRSKPVLSVDIFYTQHGKADEGPEDMQNTMHRFWHHAESIEADGVWTAKLPLSNVENPLWVYANVAYFLDEPVSGAGYYYGTYATKSFNVSSLMQIATPKELASAGTQATRKPSQLIESFEGDWEKEWFTYKPDEWTRSTHKLADETYAAPEGAELAVDVLAQQANTLVVLIDDCAAEIQLSGGDQWQSVVLELQDFRDAGGDPLGSWKNIRRLKLTPAEHLKPKRGSQGNPKLVGKRWTGAKPQFRNLRWKVGAVDSNAGSANESENPWIADAVKQARVTGGIIVLLNGSDASYEDAAGTNCTVHGLENDGARVTALRERLQADGRYGRVSVSQFNGETLPYINNLVNLVAIEGESVAQAEAMRVLAPRGIALLKANGTWSRAVKPVPDDIDEWNQYLHSAANNGVSADSVGPPQRLQWTGGTRWGRSHMSWVTVTSMLSSNGRLFTIEDLESIEYHQLPAKFHLVARDAFNGCELWRRPLNNWGGEPRGYVKHVSTQIQRRAAAIGDRVYCTLGYTDPIGLIDGATGELLKTFAGTTMAREFAYDRGVIYVILGEPYGVGQSRDAEVLLKAIDAESGTVKWEHKLGDNGGYIGGTLAVKDSVLAYCTKDRLTCLNSGSGKTLWQVPRASLIPSRGSLPRGVALARVDNIPPTLVLHGDMLYCSVVTEVSAHSLETGEVAWTAKNGANYMKSSDIFVADGLVWTGLLTGHDLKTGEVKRQLEQVMHEPMGHDRCYRNRITETYFINSKTGGSDFVTLNGEGEFPSPWVRATCGLGALPCNGMLYSSPFSCSCLQGTMLTGFNALYSTDRAAGKVMRIERRERLIKGQAYGAEATTLSTTADWPVYRNNNARSGLTPTPLSGKLAPRWSAKLPSRPTAPTIVGELVYVAARDSHTLYALSRKTGECQWTFTAGGRIDSPPAFHGGLLIFGSRDGWVYSLRADNGELAWKFCDLPDRRLMAAHGQLESAWPVSGAVMIRDEVAYFAAGRSSFLDGGIIVYGLDPLTGQVMHRRQMSGPYAENEFPVVGERNTRIEGFKGGIFSSEGELLYIRHQAFKPDLTPVPLAALKQPHLIASSGFLDDIPQHRTYWTIDTDLCYGPNTGTIGAGPQGDILVMDGDVFYEIRGYLPGRHSTKLMPQKGYTLYSGQRTLRGADGAWQADPKLRTVPRSGSWKKRWSTQIPLSGNALVVAGDTIIAAGVPLQPSFALRQLSASFAGEQGGVLWTASSKDGTKIAELTLPAPPVWDGLAAARGDCIIALKDGTVLCLR